MDFVVACVVAHDAMLEFGGTVLNMSARTGLTCGGRAQARR